MAASGCNVAPNRVCVGELVKVGIHMANQQKAILLMISAIACFAMMDALAKLLSMQVHPIQTIWARYVSQAVLVFLIVLPNIRRLGRTNYPKLQLARSVFLMLATSCFFFSISKIGLAEATAIMDVNPVLITLGAALFLGEKIGPRRIFGIAMSLIGALIIIRPGMGVFSVYAVLPLMAAVFYSGYNLFTRFVGKNESPWTSLFYSALFGAVFLSAIVPTYWTPLSATAWGMIAGIGILAALAQWMLITSLTLGEASMLAPFAYTGLISATLWGALIFDEYPDKFTIIGAVLIVASGIYVWYRETSSSQA